MSAPPSPPSRRKVRVLTVCTGNICRSPYAALRLQDRFDEVRPGAFVVASTGTHALVGRPIDPGSGQILAADGIDSADFRATLMTERALTGADAILAMNAEHQQLVVDEAPSTHRRTYLVRELAHQLVVLAERETWTSRFERHGVALDPLSRWQALPAVLGTDARSVRRRSRDRDVVDPYGRSSKAFAQMAAEIDPAVDIIASWESQFR